MRRIFALLGLLLMGILATGGAMAFRRSADRIPFDI